jgi:hypothetical protein
LGKYRRSDAAVIFPPLEVVEADNGGGMRPVGGGDLRALFWCGGRKKTAGWAGWAKRPDGPAGRWAER